VTEKDHTAFYQFIAHSFDAPRYYLHFSTDSPINIRSLFYIPQQHSERYGMGRMESGISLFCRKVLIQSKSPVLPDWLRFLRGVVDSEDIPLNLSRELLQDSTLLKRIGNVLTKRIIKWLEDESAANPEKFNQFFQEYGVFLKEGLYTDYALREDIARLMRYEASSTKTGETTSLEKYVAGMREGQKDIYYICIPSRDLAVASPYYEIFRENSVDVLFLYSGEDDLVMHTLGEYKHHRLLSIESSEAHKSIKLFLESSNQTPKNPKKPKHSLNPLTPQESTSLLQFLKTSLTDKASDVRLSDLTISEAPAVIVDHESSAFRRMMRYMDPQRTPDLPKQILEVNPDHPLVIQMGRLHASRPNLSKMLAQQMYDNALVHAGMLLDARVMLPRLNALLTSLMEGKEVSAAEIPKELNDSHEMEKEKEGVGSTGWKINKNFDPNSLD
jgi:TNF receptor-associated protein 1